LGSGRSDSFQVGGYGTLRFGAAYLSGAVAFANHWFTTNRIAVGDQLTANFTGQSAAGRFEGGYRFAVDPLLGLTPYAAVQAQYFRTPSYSETDLSGGGFGLSYSAMSATDTRGELGMRLDNLNMIGDMPLILRARLGWAHDWINDPALGAAFNALPGSSFTVNGAAPPTNSALVSGAAELRMTANWSLTAKFDGELAQTAQTYAGSGTLKYSW
jgi:outer membrane autotransporter protein